MIKHLQNLFSTRNALFVVAIAFFFCMNQYNGILVDAILYTLQAVHFVHPERFVDDVSFMYGNQDSFTIFSPLYVVCINIFGISKAAMLLCFLSHLLFAGSFSYLMYSWFNKFHCRKIFFPFLIFFFALYRFGELRTVFYPFNFIEPYVVPRTFSVSLALFGLGCFFSNRKNALLFILLGVLFNPLMAGWALPLWLFFYYPRFILPVIACSALFPLTVFLGVGSFDSFDSDWLSPASKNFYLMRFVPFGLFYFWGTIVFKKNTSLGRTFKALLFVWGIAFYWYVMAKVTQHVFLNQAQIFRMEWFCITTTFPLIIATFYRRYVLKYRRNIPISVSDYLLLAFPLLLWIDSIIVNCSLIYFFLRIKNFRVKNEDNIYAVLRIFILVVLVLIGGAKLFRIAGLNLLDEYQTKECIRSLGFIGVVAISGMYLKKRYSKRKTFALLVVLSAAIFSFSPLQFEDKSLAEVAALAVLTIVWVYPAQRMKNAIWVIPLFWLIPYAIVHYDTRFDSQIYSEKRIETFWNESIFSEVTERGDVLFVTGGFHSIHPRLQFLTGAYIDNQSLAGGLLFRKQHIDALHRMSMLFFEKEKVPAVYDHNDFSEYWESLYNVDSLKKKFSFLCSHNEIRYLATDLDIGEQKPVDSYKFPAEEGKINLYQCP